MGTPKGLLRDPDGTAWVARSVDALRAGGCLPVHVVVGAAAAEVTSLVPPGDAVRVVVAAGWAEGMAASLRAGLRALLAAPEEPVAVVVGLVDTPGVTADVVARLAALAAPSGLARAAFGGVPGHPVLLGREHWAGVLATAVGDSGARDYLAGRDVALVECGDVGHGADVDTPATATPPAAPARPAGPPPTLAL
jgi:CTP:molybdopterin cytidylyltransferase MocA